MKPVRSVGLALSVSLSVSSEHNVGICDVISASISPEVESYCRNKAQHTGTVSLGEVRLCVNTHGEAQIVFMLQIKAVAFSL